MELNTLLQFIESHPVLISFFIAFVTLTGGFLKYIYQKNKENNLKTTQDFHFNQINADNSQFIGSQYNLLTEKKHGLNLFKRHLESSNWRKETIDDNEIWICESDETYQIHSKDNYETFSESWTQIYPDKFGSKKHSVLLKIKGVSIKELTFVYCDGGRISVPLPELEIINEKQIYFWNLNSLEYKVGKVIGHFYIYNSIEGVARQSKIELRN